MAERAARAQWRRFHDRRLGTGERFEGAIDAGGVFTTSNAEGTQTFSGALQPDGSGTGMKTSTDANGCTTTWDAVYTSDPETGFRQIADHGASVSVVLTTDLERTACDLSPLWLRRDQPAAAAYRTRLPHRRVSRLPESLERPDGHSVQ